MIPYPTYLTDRVRHFEENDFVSVELRSGAGNELFEIHYFGDLFEAPHLDNPYIVDRYDEDRHIPCRVVAKDIETGEEILLFDGAQHGYDAMFCDEFDPEELEARSLTQYPLPPSRIRIDFSYGIDYEDEKEDYEIDENDRVTLINGETISWEEVKRNGFDSISIVCEDEQGNKTEIVALELA